MMMCLALLKITTLMVTRWDEMTLRDKTVLYITMHDTTRDSREWNVPRQILYIRSHYPMRTTGQGMVSYYGQGASCAESVWVIVLREWVCTKWPSHHTEDRGSTRGYTMRNPSLVSLAVMARLILKANINHTITRSTHHPIATLIISHPTSMVD